MNSYHVIPEKPSSRTRLANAVLGTVVFVGILWIVDYLRPFPVDPIGLGVGAAVFFVINFLGPKEQTGYDLEIDAGDGIRIVRDGSVKQKLSRDQIRSVHELSGNMLRKPVLVISTHGAIGARFLGGIEVPKTLHGYDEIKKQAMIWLEQSTR